MRLPYHYSQCPSQMKYQMKKFWLTASVLYEQLLSSVPYATLFPICNGMLYSLCNEKSIDFFGQKLTFFFKFNKFKPLKFFLETLIKELG